ncbi:MAG: PepSY-associated TM helix [Idiomarinaceae bacterium HL-53]|nr:MAG: PepSY-associated TM helix [Idiomarinaceae bacterium HL-53]CUS49252.1 hypothetical protein Ga0003345_2240 [Idiomarinaceae bacterium HL-53]
MERFMNQIQRAIALVTAPLGLIFLLSGQQDLWNLIVATELNWHRAFMPMAWGIILGSLAGLFRFNKIQVVNEWAIWLSTALMTFGAVGTVAIFFEHRLWFLAWPTMWLASLGVGIYAFFIMQLKFSQKHNDSQGES